MIDGKIHIGDVDEDLEVENMIEEEQSTKSNVIYENSETQSNKGTNFRKEYSDSGESEREDREDYQHSNYNSNNEYNNTKKDSVSTLIFNFIQDSYRERPNTFKATIVGIIMAILILVIGFLKSLLVFVVVLAANIIGQLLDNNPRLLSIINSIFRKFR
ncbi:DUF2273 domain-containing protein [Peptostreptococcus faecalis]|uniref:DUF2273 domain-containing protein n=1 Tax=Peptostreptococcus faecalis TaxID=2045015 RepID=UPI000C7B3FFD|nr:DUF2273 domain-containing protein [Peptostreptococcus faecalis]